MIKETVAVKLLQSSTGLDQLIIGDVVPLEQGRAHEICGPARHVWAMIIAREIALKTHGPLFWIQPEWLPETLFFEGVQAWAPPEKFIQITPRHEIDLLWASEEILRSGAAPLVMTQLTRFPSLTQIRRLHLAAQNGLEIGPYKPLCLLLSTDHGGINGVDNRFYCRSAHTAQEQIWHLHRLKARNRPVAQWRFQGPQKITILSHPTDTHLD